MAKSVFKKYPRKPKKTASVDAINSYLQRCSEIKKENDEKKAALKKLQSFKPGVSTGGGKAKRKSSAKKAATPKKRKAVKRKPAKRKK